MGQDNSFPGRSLSGSGHTFVKKPLLVENSLHAMAHKASDIGGFFHSFAKVISPFHNKIIKHIRVLIFVPLIM